MKLACSSAATAMFLLLSAFGCSSLFAEVQILLDADAKPVRDVRASTCGTVMGYAGCAMNMGPGAGDSYFFGEVKDDTARAMKESGAWFQRMWSADAWFANPKSDPKAAFEFWKANGIRILMTIEPWKGEKSKKQILDLTKFIVTNHYESCVAGFELGNETYFYDKYETLAPFWDEVTAEIVKLWPKVQLGINIGELFELNPDLGQVRSRMLAEGKISRDTYFAAADFNQYSTKFMLAMAKRGALKRITHVIWHGYGAETPYSCSYHGVKRFRDYMNAFDELKGKKMWLSEIRPRSDEDNSCQRIFRTTLVMGHYALMILAQPDIDGYNHHQFWAIAGGVYQSSGKSWGDQWYDGTGSEFPDYRSPYNRPRWDIGHCGVMYRIFTEAVKGHPLVIAHGTSKGDGEDTFYTSARVMDQAYALQRAKKEGRTGGEFGYPTSIKGETEYLATLSANRQRLCLMVVNSKPVAETITVRMKDREFAAPVFRTLSCPEQYLDSREIPGEGKFWTQKSWEDTQSGYAFWANYITKGGGWRPLPTELKAECDRLVFTVEPNTIASVEVPIRKLKDQNGTTMSEKARAKTLDHVFGNIADSAKYEKLNRRFAKAFAFLKDPELAKKPLGDYILEEGPDAKTPAIKAMVQEVELKPYGLELCHVEAHKKYIDIQAPLSGTETFGICSFDWKNPKWGYEDPKNPAKSVPDPVWSFDEARDIGFIDYPCTKVTLEPGEFAIFLPPHGAHAPCLSDNGPRKLRKVCIKVLAE